MSPYLSGQADRELWASHGGGKCQLCEDGLVIGELSFWMMGIQAHVVSRDRNNTVPADMRFYKEKMSPR